MNYRIFFISIFICGIMLPASLSAQTGREIAERAYNRDDGKTRHTEMTMRLINKRGRVRERRMMSYSMDVGKNGNDRKTLMFFTYPGDVKGTGFLTWDYEDVNRDDDRWLYLPSMKKTRRISGSSAKKDYFMGSDFTYDDMGKRALDEDDYKLLREENLEGYDCWVLEATPRGRDELYARRVIWIRKDCLIAPKIEFFDREERLQRRLLLSDIKQINGIWIALKFEMENVQREHRTELILRNPVFNEQYREAQFNVNTLEKGSL